jgi:hypothetical protein
MSEAAEILADFANTSSYAASLSANRGDGGRLIARRLNKKRRKITTNPDLTMLIARSFPKTSTTTSFIV